MVLKKKNIDVGVHDVRSRRLGRGIGVAAAPLVVWSGKTLMSYETCVCVSVYSCHICVALCDLMDRSSRAAYVHMNLPRLPTLTWG